MTDFHRSLDRALARSQETDPHNDWGPNAEQALQDKINETAADLKRIEETYGWPERTPNDYDLPFKVPTLILDNYDEIAATARSVLGLGPDEEVQIVWQTAEPIRLGELVKNLDEDMREVLYGPRLSICDDEIPAEGQE